MKRSKVLSLLMVTAMCVGLLAGCGGGNGGSSSGGSSSGGSSSGSTDSSSAGDKSPITMTFYNADGKNGNWDNPVAKAITAATGVSLEITYPVSSTGDPGEDLALMIAEDKFPDLIYSKAGVSDLYDAGALIDMTDLIEQYGPNIKKMYGDEMNKLKWGARSDGSIDEGIYQLSYAGVRGKKFADGGTCQIQWAAIKENDWKYPTTIAEYEALIKKYLAAHPTTDEGLPTIGISMSASDWHWMITLGNPAGFIADAAPDNGQVIVDDNYNVIYKHTTDNEKEYFRWLSRMYDEGILDQNFATQTDDDYIAKLSNGQVVAITDAFWHYGYTAEMALKAAGKYEQTYAPLPVTLYENQKAPTMMYQGLQVGYGIAITKSCADPVRAIQFLDYLCSDEGAILYKWGVEGENYQIDENGNRYRTQDEILKSQTDPDYAKNTGIGNYTGFPIYGDGATDENGKPYTPNTKESVIAEYSDIQKEACAAWGVELIMDIFPQESEFKTPPYSPLWAYATPTDITNKRDRLDEIAWPALVKCVTESESNFDSNWSAMVDALNKEGLEQFNKDYTEYLKTKIN